MREAVMVDRANHLHAETDACEQLGWLRYAPARAGGCRVHTSRPFVRARAQSQSNPNPMTSITPTKPLQLTLFDLDALETRIKAGMKTFIEVGEALRTVRDANGHTMRGFKTFDDYCAKEFGISIRQGQRLIEAAAVARQVEEITGELPKNEAQAREIGKIADQPALLKKVITEIKRTKTTLANATAEVVALAVAKVTGKTAPPPPERKIEEPPPITAPTLDLSVFADTCVHCGTLPEAYQRKGEAWTCPECKGAVKLTIARAS